MNKRLLVVGAGAKAAALVARASVLRDLGAKGVPSITVIEADHIGAAWSGTGQYSSGFLTLCTPGEKDVGFPYDETTPWIDTTQPVSSELFSRFSWPAFMVSTGSMSRWVDRGRPFPTHAAWSEYLGWVFEQAEQPLEMGRVTGVVAGSKGWEATALSEGNTVVYHGDGIVLTGNGDPKNGISISPDVPSGRVLDADTFWNARHTIRAMASGSVAVVGAGGAAGAVLAWLANTFVEYPVSIISVSGSGTLFTRGDGFSERQWFSDPSEWRELALDQRRKILDRTEVGVISERNRRLIDGSSRIQYERGRATSVGWEDERLEIGLETGISFAADYIVSATGFDPWTLLDLVDNSHIKAFLKTDKLKKDAEESMLADLSFPVSYQLPPGLHVPALAGLAQGPGMGNLGCLGLMARAVIQPYLS